DRRKARAYRLHQLNVAPRFDLELDSLIAAVQLALDFLQQRLGALLQADRDAALDHGLGTSEVSPERHAREVRLEIPYGRLHSTLRHPVFANGSEDPADLRSLHSTR